MKSKLYLIRHGQSTYNLENRFTGWKDVDLTDLGIGGYHMIIESTHEFSAGVMDSSFRAKWVQSIENEQRLVEVEESGTTGDGSITTKCSSGA